MQKVYVALSKPKYDPEVLILQRQINTVRRTLLHNLPIIKEDGLYGVETEKAVRAFQQACNISADGKFGPQTYASMMQKLRQMPSIGSMPSKNSVITAPMNSKPAASSETFTLYNIADQFVAAVIDFSTTINSVAKSIAELKNPSSEMVFKCFQGSLGKVDPAIGKIRKTFDKLIYHKNNSTVSTDTLQLAKKNSAIQSLQGRQAAQKVSLANVNARMTKYYLKEANSVKDVFLNNFRQYDFVSKISTRLKGMGIFGKVNLSKIAVKSPLGIGFAYSLKDIIADIFHIADLYNESKKEMWLKDLQKDCYEFLDGLIIGIVSSFLAQLIVVGGASLAGLTISAGAIVAAVTVVALIIGLIFSYVLSTKEISFSKFIFEDCAGFIIGKIAGVMM